MKTLISRISIGAFVLAVIQLLWAIFQWRELIALQGGEQTLCGLAGGNCSSAWESTFAVTIHSISGLPVAGWGVVWGIVAAVLAFALNRTRVATRAVLYANAVRMTAIGGVVGVLILALVLVTESAFCVPCAVTYCLVLGYAILAYFIPVNWSRLVDGGLVTVIATAAVFLVTLVSGMTTHYGALPSMVKPNSERATESLEAYVAALPDEVKRRIGTELVKFSNRPIVDLPVSRGLIGSPDALVRVTEFHDLLCSHCARLHEVLAHLRSILPKDFLAIDVHQYPLDSSCNSNLSGESRNHVRCVAAKAAICLEDHPNSFAFLGEVFRNQLRLDDQTVFKIAMPFATRSALEACVDSLSTARFLANDIDWASKNGIRGTPFVFVNGRETTGYGPLIYVLVLAGGDPDHPALVGLKALVSD